MAGWMAEAGWLGGCVGGWLGGWMGIKNPEVMNSVILIIRLLFASYRDRDPDRDRDRDWNLCMHVYYFK